MADPIKPTTTSVNLGLVKSIHVGPTPPANIFMIWVDTSDPEQFYHKTFNTLTEGWQAIGTDLPPSFSIDVSLERVGETSSIKVSVNGNEDTLDIADLVAKLSSASIDSFESNMYFDTPPNKNIFLIQLETANVETIKLGTTPDGEDIIQPFTFTGKSVQFVALKDGQRIYISGQDSSIKATFKFI